MSQYTRTFAVLIPCEHQPTGCRIARAIDPDVGGFNSFCQKFADSDGNKWCGCQSPVTERTAEAAPYLLADAATLREVVKRDQDARWEDEPDPTVATIEKFTGTAIWSLTQSIDELAAEHELVRVEEQVE